jgi:hypothetical protein
LIFKHRGRKEATKITEKKRINKAQCTLCLLSVLCGKFLEHAVI